MVVSGFDLKVRRMRRKVTQAKLAQRAGWSGHYRVSQIEALAVVPPDTAERYIVALETFPHVAQEAQA